MCELFASVVGFPYRAAALGPGAHVRNGMQSMVERPESAEERGLVESAQRGDETALRALLQRFSRPLYSAVIMPRVGNAIEGDEVLRDTLSRAVQRLDSYRWTGSGFFPWLRQIAIHLIIDRARARQRARKAQDALEIHSQTVAPLHHAGAEIELIEAQERASARAALMAALDTLNDRYRRAIEMRLIEDEPREACAAALGVTLGNFDVIFHRALAALRKAYALP